MTYVGVHSVCVAQGEFLSLADPYPRSSPPLLLLLDRGFFVLTIRRQPVILIHMIGININDKHQPFTDQILSGIKTIETRNSKSLHPYIGKQVGIIRTGKGKATLVGYTTIKEAKKYYNNFDLDYDKHLVSNDSPFHGQNKWGYILVDSFRCKPKLITSKGIISRKIA